MNNCNFFQIIDFVLTNNCTSLYAAAMNEGMIAMKLTYRDNEDDSGRHIRKFIEENFLKIDFVPEMEPEESMEPDSKKNITSTLEEKKKEKEVVRFSLRKMYTPTIFIS